MSDCQIVGLTGYRTIGLMDEQSRVRVRGPI